MPYDLNKIPPNQVLQRELTTNSANIQNVSFDKCCTGLHRKVCNNNPYYVGDIWVMAGGSSMQGRGFTMDPFMPRKCEQPAIKHTAILYESSGFWRPLKGNHVNQPVNLLHTVNGDNDWLPINDLDEDGVEVASLIPSFVNKYATYEPDIPIGLLVCTQENSTLDDWNAPKDGADGFLYTAMLNKIRKVGNNIAGVLWYQGESDASDSDAAESYYERLKTWIYDLCRDLNKPNLPVVIVQIGSHRFDCPTVRENWKMIQDAQYQMMGSDPYIAGVASLDAKLDSCADLSAAGLSLVGRRLAFAASKALRGDGHKVIPKISKVFRQRVTYYCEDDLKVTMSISVDFNNLNTPWNILPDQLILGFSVNGTETLVAKVVIADVKAGSLRLYLTKAMEGPLTLSYGMQPGVANLVTQDGIALPAFRDLQV